MTLGTNSNLQYVTWCHDKMLVALKEYDLEAAKNYLAMAKLWLGRS